MGFGIKKVLFLSAKSNASTDVVTKFASQNWYFKKKRFLFFLKSGPFLINGSKNHCANLIELYFSLRCRKLS